MGSRFAKGVAIASGLPFVAVNHLEAHALTPRLPGLVPDGRRSLLAAAGLRRPLPVRRGRGVGRYRRLGGTVDDAAGEAFDKVGKAAGPAWPGGPALERLARQGDPAVHPLPRPIARPAGLRFQLLRPQDRGGAEVGRLAAARCLRHVAADIAAGFQRAVAEVLADRAAHAMTMMRERSPAARALVVAGGVAANGAVRAALAAAAATHGFELIAPPVRLCTDNAVMVAWAGIERLRLGLTNEMNFAPRPRWPLEQLAM